MKNPTSTTPTITTSSQEFTTVPIDNNEENVATNTATTTPASGKGEKAPNRMMRTTKNAWRRAVGCCKKSTPRTKIRLKEHEIAKRKKAFGMEYIDLVRNSNGSNATDEQLQQAVQACLQDIDGLMQEIVELENKIEQVSEETKSKLKPQPAPVTYANSGLYSGGDPSLEGEEEDMKSPPQGAFSITSAEDEDDDSGPEKESWLPPPPSTPPPAVPVEDTKPSV